MANRKPSGGEEDKVTTNFKMLRSRLERERQRLLDELAQLAPSVRPGDERREGSPFGKREEEATETMELEKRLALEKRTKEQLADIDHALAKFDKGTYGRCDICGQPIDPARLEARPQSNLCMTCKAKYKDAKPRLAG